MIPKYEYQFSVNGKIENPKKLESFINELQFVMEHSLYNMSSSKDCVFADIDLETESNGNIYAITLHTYQEKFGVRGKYIKQKNLDPKDLSGFMKKCLEYVSSKILTPNEPVKINDNVRYIGMKGEIPNTLYHITEYKNIDSILTNGLIPDRGKNNFSNSAKRIFLTDYEDICPWLCVLEMKEPIILEVNTKNISKLKTGRVYNDRKYVDYFGEYCTTKPIPTEGIKCAEFSKEQYLTIYNTMIELVKKIPHYKPTMWETYLKSDQHEVWRGLQRLWPTGIINGCGITALNPVTYCCDILHFEELAEQNNITLTDSTNNDIDDFTKSVIAIPMDEGYQKK